MNTPVLSLPLHESVHTTLAPIPPVASIVQTAPAVTATSGTVITCTLPNPTTAGNTLIAYIGTSQTSTNPQVSGILLGGGPDSWFAAKVVNVAGTANCEIWVDWNCGGGQTSVQVTFTAGSGTGQEMIVSVEEWSLIQNSATPTDQVNGHATLNTTFTSNATSALSQANELAVACVYAGATPTGTGLPWTNQAVLATGGGTFLLKGYQIVSSTAGLTYSGSLSVNTVYSCVIVTLKLQTLPPSPPAGSGTARISPGQPASPGSGVGASRNSGLQWDVSGIAVSVATNVKEATAAAYISYGIQSNTPDDFQGQTQTGSTGDTCTVNATIRPGDWITVIWTGGDPGAIATARIFGTITPPGVS